MEGYILLYRKTQDHWLYEKKRPKTKFEAWIHILFSVNFKPSKVHIRGIIYDCNRGQILYSLETWAKELNWSTQQVRTYFKQLETDQMITTEGLQYTTRLTVCNYDSYQCLTTDEQQAEQQANNKPLTDEQQAANNNRKKGKKEKKEYPIEILELNEKCKKYFDEKYINENSLDCFDKLIRLDGYSIVQIQTAILNARSDDFWNKQFQTPVKLRDKDKSKVLYIDKFLAIAKPELKKEPAKKEITFTVNMDGTKNYLK